MIGEKIYIGFSLGFNTSASVVSSNRGVLSAISQERLNCEKNTREFPYDAILKCCKTAGVKEVDWVSFSHWRELTLDEIERYTPSKYVGYFNNYKKSGRSPEEVLFKMIKSIARRDGVNIKCRSMERVEHHRSHMYSSYGFYGFDETHVNISCDGFGDGVTNRISVMRKGSEDVLFEAKMLDSIGLVYQYVTGALGFKEHQHEGKVTGLAAFGEPVYYDELVLLLEDMRAKIFTNEKSAVLNDTKYVLSEKQQDLVNESTIVDFDELLVMKDVVYGFVNKIMADGAKMEDVAASVQKYAEEEMCKRIAENVKLDEKLDCFLSGGLFANVKLNQRIREMGVFREVFVVPPMGDEGTAVGSAMHSMMRDGFNANANSEDNLKRVLSGTSMKDDYVRKSVFEKCKQNKVFDYEGREDELANHIAKALAEKKIVCMCRGRMEFGPRALCDRSILYECTDPSVNKWLNDQLSRTEFMPFAPVCQRKNAEKFFEDFERGKNAAKFMTMTFSCKNEFVEKYPAANHVDNTARPQVVNDAESPFMCKVLERYFELTGLEVLINTSFNLHNHPIIENEDVAIESWKKSNTDVLVLNDVLIER